MSDGEKETRHHLEALYAATLKDWVGPGSYDARVFDEALADARAAGEAAYRGSLGRRDTREQAADAWRAAFTNRFRDRTMTGLAPHRNRAGIEFRIWWSPVPLPADAPYWHYRIDVRLSNGRGRAYNMLVRKGAYPTQAKADAFLLTDPLAAVKAELELADDKGVPLFWRKQLDDWQMY